VSIVEKPDAEVTAQLLDAEARRQRALIDVDLDALDDLLEDSLIHIHAPGLTHTKAQLLEHTATRRAYLEITRGELNLRIIGDVALMTGPIVNRLRTADGGERTLDGVATQVLHRDNAGVWRFVSFQLTPYGEQAWSPLPSELPADQDEAPQS
jgi:ketosteroid isomerase-like protein